MLTALTLRNDMAIIGKNYPTAYMDQIDDFTFQTYDYTIGGKMVVGKAVINEDYADLIKNGDDAAKLVELLNLAGIHQSNQSCSSCGQSPCGCGGQMVDENSLANGPDPVFASVDQVAGPQYGGGPNAPHVMINPADPTFNPPGDMAQDTVNAGPGARRLPATTNEGIQADLGMSLYKELQQFKGK
jgi:hypothetical protein